MEEREVPQAPPPPQAPVPPRREEIIIITPASLLPNNNNEGRNTRHNRREVLVPASPESDLEEVTRRGPSTGRKRKTTLAFANDGGNKRKNPSNHNNNNRRTLVVDDDDDFEPARQPRKRKFSEIAKSAVATEKPTSTTTTASSELTEKVKDTTSGDDYAIRCSICYDPWTESGDHKVCCLKCGHLFGKSCIESWLSRAKSCPTCKAKSTKRDVRVLFVANVGTVDTTELDKVRAELTKERKKKEYYKKDLIRIKAEYQQLQTRYNAVSQRHHELRSHARPGANNHAVESALLMGLSETEMALNFGQEYLAVATTTSSTTTTPSSSGVSPQPPLPAMPPLCSPPPSPFMLSMLNTTISSSPPLTPPTPPTPPCKSVPHLPNKQQQQNRSRGPAYPQTNPSLSRTPVFKSLRPLINNSTTRLLRNPHTDFLQQSPPDWDGGSQTPPSQNVLSPPAPPVTSHLSLARRPFKERFKLVNTLPTPLQCARVVELDGQGHLLVSTARTSNSFGVLKVSLLDINHIDLMPSIHTSMIRDIKWGEGRGGDGFVLTASQDNTLCITSPRTSSVVLRYNVDNPSWACVWRREDEHTFYAAIKEKIALYDTRQTRGYVTLYTPPENKMPIHSLCPIPLPSSPNSILLGSVSGAFCMTPTSDGTSVSFTRLPFGGSCSSVAFDTKSGCGLVSFRNTLFSTKPSHTIFRPEVNHHTSQIAWEGIRTVYSTAEQNLLSRSTIFSVLEDEDDNVCHRLLVAASDESANAVSLWDGGLGPKLQCMPHTGVPMDMRPFSEGHSSFIATLSEKQLRIHQLVPIE